MKDSITGLGAAQLLHAAMQMLACFVSAQDVRCHNYALRCPLPLARLLSAGLPNATPSSLASLVHSANLPRPLAYFPLTGASALKAAGPAFASCSTQHAVHVGLQLAGAKTPRHPATNAFIQLRLAGNHNPMGGSSACVCMTAQLRLCCLLQTGASAQSHWELRTCSMPALARASLLALTYRPARLSCNAARCVGT